MENLHELCVSQSIQLDANGSGVSWKHSLWWKTTALQSNIKSVKHATAKDSRLC